MNTPGVLGSNIDPNKTRCKIIKLRIIMIAVGSEHSPIKIICYFLVI